MYRKSTIMIRVSTHTHTLPVSAMYSHLATVSRVPALTGALDTVARLVYHCVLFMQLTVLIIDEDYISMVPSVISLMQSVFKLHSPWQNSFLRATMYSTLSKFVHANVSRVMLSFIA